MKRSLALFCIMALLLGMVIPGTTRAADTGCPCCGAENVTWEIFTADTIPVPGVHYRLAGNVDKKGQLTLATAGVYCVDMAGYSLSTDSRAFIAGDNTAKPAVILNLMDSSANQTGVIKGEGSTNAAWSAGVLYSCSQATINLYSGTITSKDVNTASAGKGAVVNALGNFNMYGGKIIGGTAQTFGGAVSVQSKGIFTMSGGTIQSGTAPVGACVYIASTAKMILSGDARPEQVYVDGTLTDCLTVSGKYTGSVEIAGKNEITSGSSIAASDNADISGAVISVPNKDLAASVSGNAVVVGKGSWCEACKANVVWQELAGSLTAEAAGHYKLTQNVGASQVTIKTGAKICLDLAGYTYAGSGRTIVLGASYSAGGQGEVLNVMDSSEEKTGRLTGRGGSNAMAGGVIYSYKNTTVNVYGGTIAGVGEGDVIAKNGGALDTYGAVNIYGGTIVGNSVASYGGAVCLLSGTASLQMSGGTIVSGTAAVAGDCVYVASGAKVKLSGDARIPEIYFAGKSASTLVIADAFTGMTTLKYASAPAEGADLGDCTGTVGKESISVADTRMFTTVSGGNLVAVTLTGASVTGDTTVYYDTLDAALAAAKSGNTVKLLEAAENASAGDGLILDLNGWDLNTLTVTGTVSVKDSTTDDYTVDDTEAFGKIGTVSGAVQACDGYIALTDGGMSFHKYILEISKVNLRPGATGIYYTADILVDETVLGKLQAYGIAVSTTNKMPAVDAADTLYTAYGKADYGTAGTAGVLISGIMDGEATDAADAATDIYGRPYIAFADGSYFYGKAVSTNLQKVTEVINEKAWGKLSLQQNRAIMAMYQTYAREMDSWKVDNFAQSVAKKQAAAEDGILKAIVIGNSASVDATALLAGIFKTEAPEQKFVLGCMYESGCSVVGHVGFLQTDAAAYTYYKNMGEYELGTWTLHKDSTLEDGLADQNWDVVIFQELHTVSGLMSTFENDNLETLITYVINTVGYEPQLDWHSVGIIPEIPKAYADYVMSLEGDDGGGTDAGENEGWEDDGTSQPEDLAWIFDIARPGYPVTWAKNYIKNFNNDAQTMYDAICDVAVNHIMPSELYSFDDVIPGGSVIQYARNMGMTDRDLFRDYAHKSDYGRVLIGYVWYASLMGITEFEELQYTTVPAQMRQKKFVQYGDLVLSEEQYNMALAAINYALENPFDSPDPVTAQ